MIALAVDAQQDSELVEIQAEAETTPAKVIRRSQAPSAKSTILLNKKIGNVYDRNFSHYVLNSTFVENVNVMGPLNNRTILIMD